MDGRVDKQVDGEMERGNGKRVGNQQMRVDELWVEEKGKKKEREGGGWGETLSHRAFLEPAERGIIHSILPHPQPCHTAN